MAGVVVFLTLLCASNVIVINAGCGKQKLVRKNAAFVLDLYKELAKEDGNLFFSPLSISQALAMTLLAARGNTSDEMKQTMSLTGIRDRVVHKHFNQLSTCLQNTSQNYVLELANKIYPEKTFTILKKFKRKLRRFYEVELESVDFQTNAEGARETINEWVEQQTEDRIQNLIGEGAVDHLTAAVLVNAVYFKADWQDQFKTDFTSDGDFWLNDVENMRVPIMHHDSFFYYSVSEDLNCKILELPYKGKKMSMFVLLPNDRVGLDQLLHGLTAGHLRDPLKMFDMQPGRVLVSLPKFSVEQSFDLKQVLQRLGIKDLFNPEASDLSGMDGTGNITVSKVLHKAFINVAEAGTEAAAVTGVFFSFHSMPPSFVADHPFLFLIRDNVAQTVVFLGRVMRP